MKLEVVSTLPARSGKARTGKWGKVLRTLAGEGKGSWHRIPAKKPSNVRTMLYLEAKNWPGIKMETRIVPVANESTGMVHKRLFARVV